MNELFKDAYIICNGCIISEAPDGHWDVEDGEDIYPFETLDQALVFAIE